MKYIFLLLAIIIAVLSHWHYYRYCVFSRDIDRPLIYSSHIGDLIILILKVVLFGVILLFFRWYFVFIPLIFFQILKEIAFSKSLNAVKKIYGYEK